MIASHPLAPGPLGPSAQPPSLHSLALCLAYVAYCNPIPPRRGPLLRRDDARRLAAWLGAPPVANPLRHATLPLHLIWLAAAGLLRRHAAGLRLAPTAADRLDQPPAHLRADFLDAAASPTWDAAADHLGLSGVVPDAHRLFACQTLARRPYQDELPRPPLAVWQSPDGDQWRLRLRANGDPGLLFQLLALGHYQPDGRLTLSPLSLGAPPARRLSYDRVRWLLETATDAPLTAPQQAQLRDWQQRAAAYRLRGPLLITARPEQLAALYATRRLRPYLVDQIAPRCALFDRAGLPALRRRLAVLGYPLHVTPSAGAAAPAPPDTAALWLGLRLLADLPRLAALPGPIPQGDLDRLAAALPADDVAVLEAQADRLLADLQAVIQGRDAFLPARHAPPPELLAQLRAAIADEQPLTLDYTPPNCAEPRRHTVEPLRLEQRDQLTYLVAYSYRAEATLTLRLDRLHLLSSSSNP